MKVQLTEFECLQEAGQLYSGYLTLEKAIKFLKFEKDWDIEIIEDEKITVNVDFCNSHNINIEHMIFMKRLQESGELNMIHSIPTVETRLFVTRKEAKDILNNYIKYYNHIYYPHKAI